MNYENLHWFLIPTPQENNEIRDSAVKLFSSELFGTLLWDINNGVLYKVSGGFWECCEPYNLEDKEC